MDRNFFPRLELHAARTSRNDETILGRRALLVTTQSLRLYKISRSVAYEATSTGTCEPNQAEKLAAPLACFEHFFVSWLVFLFL